MSERPLIAPSACWSWLQAGEALAALARHAGLVTRDLPAPRPPAELNAEQRAAWLEAAGVWLDLEVETVSSPYPDIETLLRRAGPALLVVGEDQLLALVGGRGGTLRVLTPALVEERVPLEGVREGLTAPQEARYRGLVEQIIRGAALDPARVAAVRRGLLQQLLAKEIVSGCFVVRLPPSAPLLPQLRAAGVDRALLSLVLSHGAGVVLLMAAWFTLGRGALSGGLDAGWLVAWALLLLTAIPFRMLTVWAQGRLSLGFGGVLKRRLLLGALRLSTDEVRHQGAGRFLGQVIESEAVESLALSGGLMSMVAIVELFIASGVLARGAGGGGHGALLGLWLCVAVGLTVLILRARQRWTSVRLEITHDLVERMVGHRTRLAQLSPDRWHEGEDEALARYLAESATMDRRSALASALLPGGWLVLALLGLGPAFVGGGDPVALAVGLGGVMMALGALQSLAAGISSLGGAWIAWGQVAPLYAAASREDARPAPTLALSALPQADPPADQVVVHAHDLGFRYPGRAEAVFRGASFVVRARERLLLEGPSGGGKSTLASLLVGLRAPAEGLLLLRGLDRATLGSAGWRRRVAAAPQFHENHVLTGTFAFNLLLGRQWPPSNADLEEAEQLCHALGLGPLLERMPAGMSQMVGETGWQLSHGEKSRLYLARALLQRAELVVLDESFAALDPENLGICLEATLDRAPALLVIAHP